MKTREEVGALFREKYEYLKTVCQQQIGPFNESAIFQNPDGGWQLNVDQPIANLKAAITLRPNDEEPHETHGVIGARWFQEGGAFDSNGIPGWLGYPVADEERGAKPVRLPSYSYLPIELIHGMQKHIEGHPWDVINHYVSIWKPYNQSVSYASSQFEFGEIEFHEGSTWEQAAEELNYNALHGLLPIVEEFSSPPNIGYYLPPSGEGIRCLPSAYPWPSPDMVVKLKAAVREGHMSGTDLAAFFGNSSDSFFVYPPEVSVTPKGKRHVPVPKEIEKLVETILITQGFRVVGGRSWHSEFYHHLYKGLRWTFVAEVEGYNHFSMLVWREESDIHVTIGARSSSTSFFGQDKTINQELVFPVAKVMP